MIITNLEVLKVSPNSLFSELLDFKEDTLDSTLQNYFKDLNSEERELLKNIIVHIDKNY